MSDTLRPGELVSHDLSPELSSTYTALPGIEWSWKLCPNALVCTMQEAHTLSTWWSGRIATVHSNDKSTALAFLRLELEEGLVFTGVISNGLEIRVWTYHSAMHQASHEKGQLTREIGFGAGIIGGINLLIVARIVTARVGIGKECASRRELSNGHADQEERGFGDGRHFDLVCKLPTVRQ